TEVIKTELSSDAVCNVSHIRFLLRRSLHHRDVQADRQSEEAVNLTDLIVVTFRKIIINCNNVHTFSFKRAQIGWQGSDKRLSFTSRHFCNIAFSKYNSADKLNVKMTHA